MEWQLLNRCAVCALALAVGACSRSQNEPRDVAVDAPEAARAPAASAAGPVASAPIPVPATPDSAGPYQRSFPDPFVQHAYKSAVNGCFYFPPEALAKQFATRNDREAIARAYSLQLDSGAHRDAGYVGCLEGLSAPGAGKRKQFGTQP